MNDNCYSDLIESPDKEMNGNNVYVNEKTVQTMSLMDSDKLF